MNNQTNHFSDSKNKKEIGDRGENLAAKILADFGFLIVSRNWRCRYGELDIIAWQEKERLLAFIEVKTRCSDRFGGSRWMISPEKYRRLRSLVGQWMQHCQQPEVEALKKRAEQIRIDFLGLDARPGQPAVVTYIPGI